MTWPQINYEHWKETYNTLHRWLQIIGKVKMCKSPWLNHSWGATLFVSSRGFTTGSIPLGEKNLTIEFDFIDHELKFMDSLGFEERYPLKDETVASFYRDVLNILKKADVVPTFLPVPNEMTDAIPFSEDLTHHTYVKEEAYNCWQVMVRVDNVFKEFRSQYVGKSSPSHFFWGSFDLAVTRFSGRRAPEHPGGIPHISNDVVKEAYSHELMSCGFWPGSETHKEAVFYSYAYPEPKGFSKAKILPEAALYDDYLKEFILPYDAVRKSKEPERVLMHFLESSYEAAAELGGWEREILEVSPALSHIKLKTAQEFGSTTSYI